MHYFKDLGGKLNRKKNNIGLLGYLLRFIVQFE